MGQTILICEDDVCLSEVLQRQLRAGGYGTRAVGTGGEALERERHEAADLVLLDLMLPDMDGLDVCRRLRALTLAPVIMITGRNSALDRIVGLEVGADDYLAKPFSVRELMARVGAQLRRAQQYARLDGPWGSLVLGDLGIDVEAREATLAGMPLRLTPKEFDLLWALAEERGSVVRSASLLLKVWGYDARIRTRTLDVHIGRLRAKIESDTRHPQRILTVPGVGYKLCVPRQLGQVA
jgi:two-component system response regulator MtrA